MGLPAAAQKQVDEANKLHSKIYDEKENETPPEGEGEPTPEPEVVVEPEQLSPAAPPPEAPPVEEDFKHKYDVLQGKYNAEMPRLQDQVRQLEGLLAGMQKEQPAPVPEPIEPKTLLTAEEVEDYGSDMIDVVKRAAMEAVSPELERLKNENAELRKGVGGVQNHVMASTRQRMLDSLATAVPTWNTVNTDPEFVGWLQQVDAYSGARRQELLLHAFEQNDTARVVAFFEGYLSENAAVSGGNGTPAPRTAQVDLNTLVAPGKQREGTPRAQEDDTRRWSNAEISAFYRKVREGKFKSREKDRPKIEQSIIDAAREGRVY